MADRHNHKKLNDSLRCLFVNGEIFLHYIFKEFNSVNHEEYRRTIRTSYEGLEYEIVFCANLGF